LVDARISGLRLRFGEIGDQRLIIMAAITLADEWSEANERVRDSKPNSRGSKRLPLLPPSGRAGCVSLGEAALRIEQVAQELNDSSRE